MPEATLVLRLSGPLQSWGSSSAYNRRDTDDRPTKSGVVGLLAAAQGRRRSDPIEDLVRLRLGVRVDQPGTLLRDYHTVSDLRGRALLSAATNAKGVQKTTSPKKFTHVTTRYYLQDAVFVAAVRGPRSTLAGLADALAKPAFPLALGRRSCVPSKPVLFPANDDVLWTPEIEQVLETIPWQASGSWQRRCQGSTLAAATLDAPNGEDVVRDVPVSFDPPRRGMVTRRVTHRWIRLGTPANDHDQDQHDPFAALGW